MTTRNSHFPTVLILALCACTPALAQVERSGGSPAQKIMQQYQQVAAEKTALQAQLAQMKKDLDAAQTELAAVKKERDAAKAQPKVPQVSAAQLALVTAAKDTAEKNLDQYKQRMNELVARFRETAGNLRDVESTRTQLKSDLEARNTAFDKCADANLQLYEINGEILKRFDNVGLFTKVSSAEPFTRITRARIENLVDEYRERALQLRIKQPTP
jgi:SMC interacting uncharacterized protein involved in chromosome segregation